MTTHNEKNSAKNTEARLLFERQGGVATLTLNRPEARNQKIAGRSHDVREGIRAFLEKRKPEFRGR